MRIYYTCTPVAIHYRGELVLSSIPEDGCVTVCMVESYLGSGRYMCRLHRVCRDRVEQLGRRAVAAYEVDAVARIVSAGAFTVMVADFQRRVRLRYTSPGGSSASAVVEAGPVSSDVVAYVRMVKVEGAEFEVEGLAREAKETISIRVSIPDERYEPIMNPVPRAAGYAARVASERGAVVVLSLSLAGSEARVVYERITGTVKSAARVSLETEEIEEHGEVGCVLGSVAT